MPVNKSKPSLAKALISALLLACKVRGAEEPGLRDFNKVICPELKCDSEQGKDKMEAVTPETCYLMQREDVNLPIYARECYD